MASAIDATKPTAGSATTQSMRDNFAAAKSEIEALQAGTGLAAGSVVDAAIGNRTPDQTVAAVTGAGTLTQVFNWFANRIKAISGETNWYDAVGTSLKSHVGNVTNPHGVTLAQAGMTDALAAKTTLVDADLASIMDSAASFAVKKITWANVKTVLASAFSSTPFSVGTATAAAHGLRAGQYGSQINGWTYANNGADATNDLDIAAGSGLDSTRAYFIVGAAMTKQSDVAWAPGTNAGMLDTGAVGDGDYYIWAIARSDTGVIDYLSSLSSTAPSMPASYDYKRLIGWFKRAGGTIVAFHTYEISGGGIEFSWDSPTLDINLANTLTTARRTDAIKVPLNFSVLAHINIRAFDATSPSKVYICCPDAADLAPSDANAPLSTLTGLTTFDNISQVSVRTSSTGTIASRAIIATVDAYLVSTLWFTWDRRA